LGPKYIILPSITLATSTFLQDLASTLEKGAGDLVFLCADYFKGTENRVTNNDSNGLTGAMKEASIIIDDMNRKWEVIMVTIDGELLLASMHARALLSMLHRPEGPVFYIPDRH
jgi:hypothetical protein